MRALAATLLAVLALSPARSATASNPLEGLSARMQQRVSCSISAALAQRIPVNLLLGVAEMEGGKPGQAVRNDNGTYDLGPMQFNTRYLAYLEKKYGITKEQASGADCYPYRLAAWRLRKHLSKDAGDVWTRAANYHSKTPQHNAKYRAKLLRLSRKWEHWLADRFPTRRFVQAPEVPTIDAALASATQGARSGLASASHEETQPPPGHSGPDVEATLSLLDHRSGCGSRCPDRLGTDSLATTLALLDSPGNRVQPLSSSIGSSDAGTLARGSRLPAHPGYQIRKGDRAWATDSVARWVTAAFDEMPSGTTVRIHDLSSQHGGHLRGHQSHQSGRDMDLGYYQRTCRGPCPLRKVSPRTLDAKRQWRLLSQWLTRDQAEFIFVDYSLQKPLHQAAAAMGTSDKELSRWFQYPRGSATRRGIIRHIPKHADHIHVRFRCTAEDSACKPTRNKPARPKGLTESQDPALRSVDQRQGDGADTTVSLLNN